MEVVGLFLGIREQGAEVGQLSVGGLGVVGRDCLGRIGPGFISVVEHDTVLAGSVEVVVVLKRRSCHAKPCGIDILAVERVVVETEVVAGVRSLDVHLVELPFMGPLYYSLVLHGVREGESLEYPGGVLPDAVPDQGHTVPFRL